MARLTPSGDVVQALKEGKPKTGPKLVNSTLRARSAKRESENYGAFVAERLALDPRCSLGADIAVVDGRHLCTRDATGLHHLRKRSDTGALCCWANTTPACSQCNTWVEDNPGDAHDLGLAIRSRDRLHPVLSRWSHKNRHGDRCTAAAGAVARERTRRVASLRTRKENQG